MGKIISKKKKRKMKAKAVIASQQEVEREISGKMRDRLHLQYGYCEARLIRIQKGVQLRFIEKILKKAIGNKKKIVKWRGEEYYTDVLMADFQLEHFYYKRAVMDENNLKDALVNAGFSEKDIKGVEDQKYIKDHDNLKKMEEKSGKKEKIDYVG